MGDRFEPNRARRGSSSDRIAERLGKDATPAISIGAAKSTNRNAYLNRAPSRRQNQKLALIAAVHPFGLPPAIGTANSAGTTSRGDENEIGTDLNPVDQQTHRRHQSPYWMPGVDPIRPDTRRVGTRA